MDDNGATCGRCGSRLSQAGVERTLIRVAREDLNRLLSGSVSVMTRNSLEAMQTAKVELRKMEERLDG